MIMCIISLSGLFLFFHTIPEMIMFQWTTHFLRSNFLPQTFCLFVPREFCVQTFLVAMWDFQMDDVTLNAARLRLKRSQNRLMLFSVNRSCWSLFFSYWSVLLMSRSELGCFFHAAVGSWTLTKLWTWVLFSMTVSRKKRRFQVFNSGID